MILAITWIIAAVIGIVYSIQLAKRGDVSWAMGLVSINSMSLILNLFQLLTLLTGHK